VGRHRQCRYAVTPPDRCLEDFVQVVDCVSGQYTGPPFYALNTFYADGNVLEVPFGNPTGRTASHGTWKKAGSRTVASYSRFGLLDANGFYSGYAVLERMFDFAQDWRSATVRAKATFYSVDDQVLFGVCATADGERLPEPLPFGTTGQSMQ